MRSGLDQGNNKMTLVIASSSSGYSQTLALVERLNFTAKEYIFNCKRSRDRTSHDLRLF